MWRLSHLQPRINHMEMERMLMINKHKIEIKRIKSHKRMPKIKTKRKWRNRNRARARQLLALLQNLPRLRLNKKFIWINKQRCLLKPITKNRMIILLIFLMSKSNNWIPTKVKNKKTNLWKIRPKENQIRTSKY